MGGDRAGAARSVARVSEDGALTGTATWTDAAWRAAALAWAQGELGRLGLAMRGDPEQPHVMPWSTVLRLDVDGAPVWLKAVGPGSSQEAPLSVALAEWVPDRVLAPLAVHPGRRLSLLPDGGPTLRESGRSAAPEAWEAMLAEYGQLQLDLAPHVHEMVALGVPDARPERLPGLVAELVADDDAMLLGRPSGMTTAVRERITAELGTYAECCRRLAGSGVPASLQHDDLHDGNVFVGADGHRFFDWGDATVSHPFLSLLVSLRMAARALDVEPGDPVLLRLRDAYLEPWAAHGSRAELRELCRIALLVGPPARALSWHRIVLGILLAERVEWAASVPGWMATYLETGSLDGPAVPSPQRRRPH
jgi:hypothetical protein